jgi:hypothetical protein
MIKKISIFIMLVMLIGAGGYNVFGAIHQKQTSSDTETMNSLINTLRNPSLAKSINITDDTHPATW